MVKPKGAVMVTLLIYELFIYLLSNRMNLGYFCLATAVAKLDLAIFEKWLIVAVLLPCTQLPLYFVPDKLPV